MKSKLSKLFKNIDVFGVLFLMQVLREMRENLKINNGNDAYVAFNVFAIVIAKLGANDVSSVAEFDAIYNLKAGESVDFKAKIDEMIIDLENEFAIKTVEMTSQRIKERQNDEDDDEE